MSWLLTFDKLLFFEWKDECDLVLRPFVCERLVDSLKGGLELLFAHESHGSETGGAGLFPPNRFPASVGGGICLFVGWC